MPGCYDGVTGMMGAMGWWWLAAVLIVVVLVTVVLALLMRPRGSAAPADPARDALRERYARGEIPREEYEERDAVLSRRAGRRG